MALYVTLFSMTVRVGNTSYGFVGDGTRRGGFRYYWFSRDGGANRSFETIFTPILYGVMGLRRYSDFDNERSLEAWAEQQKNIFMDDVRQL